MPNFSSNDLTLPAVVAPSIAGTSEKELTLTIIFHPVTRRIGETAYFGQLEGEGSRTLGRLSPDFSGGRHDSSCFALNDPYISRKALLMHYRDGAVVISRGKTSSRCCVGGAELSGELQLSSEQLGVGVPILLSGRVVLLLRRAMPILSSPKQAATAQTLRGSSAYMHRLRAQIFALASTDLDVLILGETGTGKELVAHAIHATDNRASGKLVTVNMAAIPVDLAPAALFGSARGAFTGANKATTGYFEKAEGGVLFLDEIGDTPEKIQAQLLRVLQQREIQVVGGPIRTVDVRIISATDAQLDENSCSFKAALRHRLAQSEITLPPLREHPEDIGELLWFFIQTHMNALGRGSLLPEQGSKANELATWAELFHHFLIYSWPGNIRELGNFSQQLAVASELSVTIPEAIRERLCPLNRDSVRVNVAAPKKTMQKSAPCSIQDFRAGYKSARYEVAKAARQLGISRQAVYRHISDSPDLCLASQLSLEQIQMALHRSKGDISRAASYLKVSQTALRERIRNTPLRHTG